MTCVAGACFVPNGGLCTPGADALCAPGTFCIAGACVTQQTDAGAPCSSPSHCAPPLVCGDGQCQLPTGETECVLIKGKTICNPKDDPALGADTGLAASIPVPPGGLPVSASLKLDGFVVGDQGACGSCVAFATRSAMGLRAIGQEDNFTSFSAAHIWHIAGYGAENCATGSYIGKVFDDNINHHEHVVPTTIWPYNPSTPKTSLDAVPPLGLLEAEGIAHITTSGYVDANSVDNIKAAIAMGWPVVIGVRFFQASGWGSNDGLIDVPPPGSPPNGYHAVAVTSYDDLTSRFGFVNSWGTDFGVSGFGRMTYAFVTQYSTGGRAIPGLSYSPCVGGLCGVCGDGICNAIENASNCCVDCGCSGGNICQGGACGCPSGLTSCSGICRNLLADPATCGACGHPCEMGEVCLNGQCKPSCGALTECNNSCVNLLTSTASCGSCGHACAPGEACFAGQCACVPSSPPAEVCDGNDNDCDGLVDEDPACVVCVDLDDVSVISLANTVGDGEFDGSGPDADITVALTRSPTTITATTCVTMKETESDWTTGVKCVSQTQYVNNTALVSDPLFEVKYVDTDHDWDDAITASYYLLDNGVVEAVSCIGDTSGNDVCSGGPPSCAGCILTLGCVNVRVPPS